MEEHSSRVRKGRNSSTGLGHGQWYLSRFKERIQRKRHDLPISPAKFPPTEHRQKDPKFPLTEWDRLIPQANITLNLLRTARTNPSLSAYAYIQGNFNFSATPLAPPGTKVIVHVDPSVRGTWELNGDKGYYVGPSLDHYRFLTCYFPRTRTTRICETVTFVPHEHEIPFPAVTMKDHLKQAAKDIVTILTQPPAPTVPSLQEGDPIWNALLDMATQLRRMEDLPTPPQLPVQPMRVQQNKTNTTGKHNVVAPNEVVQPTRLKRTQ